MNFTSLTLSDLEPLLVNAKCPCHIINPSKTRIILWKDQKDNQTYHLRIGIQKFISYPLQDKNEALYWRFQGYDKVSGEKVKTEPLNNHDNNSESSAPNGSELSESVSH